tara:strand:- start:599 stop:775 length:177 start_codon:yes stop_codon:yes gene_type:complete
VPGDVLTVTPKRVGAAFLINMDNYVLKSLKKIFLDFAPREGRRQYLSIFKKSGTTRKF